mmetsp:Transcript_80922/g.177590  ORF Transcript_80922/g.177590 Transcript_80922/m.177590 type:complete len:1120 (-) Transcript_80922:488-3847(-)
MSIEEESVGDALEERDEDMGEEEEEEGEGEEDGEDMEGEEDEEGEGISGPYNATEVNDQIFDELKLPQELVQDVQKAWQALLSGAESREAAGEAIYGALFDAAPSLQGLFKTPRAVMSMRFVNGIHQIMSSLGDPKELKTQVETLGFQHLDLEVTIPRVAIFRDAIIELLIVEAGPLVTPQVHNALCTILNYIGGSYIYIRAKFSERLKTIASSWAHANNKAVKDEVLEAHDGGGEQNERSGGSNEPREAKSETHKKRSNWGLSSGKAAKQSAKQLNEQAAAKEKNEFQNASIPKTFDDMFAFNVAVMGMSGATWMSEILSSFGTIVTNVSNSYRLQEECDVLSLRLAKYNQPINLSEFKSVMLASLRSLCKDWDSNHEVAWSWLWSNVERLVKSTMGKPRQQEAALANFLRGLDDNAQMVIRREVYVKFFSIAPAGQDYFKQSSTRLHFIADKLVAMTLETYRDPKKLVIDISAMGLRHVGYAVPTDLFGPFVSACVQVVRELTTTEASEEAFRWSLSLISRILVRVITEGSTVVMRAINANSAKMLRRAVDCAPRGQRALWTLNVQVGTQSISPFLLSIQTGSLEASEAILVDLLTIRADRDRYYYGVDMLFQRHPDVIKRLTLDAPPLLPILFDGMVWRSRTTENGLRRVNYYVEHLIKDSEGGFARAIEWITEYQDPKVVCHPVMALVMDTVWIRVAFRSFLASKAWFLFTLVIFVLSQSLLPQEQLHDEKQPSQSKLYAIFAMRVFIYCFSMGQRVFHHVRLSARGIRMGQVKWVKCIPIPDYLHLWQESVALFLTLFLVLMLCTEPILYCLGKDGSDNDLLFSWECDAGKSVLWAYSILSSCCTVLYFVLLTDLSVLSTKVSAFVLVCRRVLTEVMLSFGATAFVIVVFAFAVNALDHDDENYTSFDKAMLHLARMSLGMVSGHDHDNLRNHPLLQIAVLVYLILSVVFLLNLLIAQLTCAYQATFWDMVGYARLNRGSIMTEIMPTVSQKRWDGFVRALELDVPIEFGEGDIGLAGGIQVFEPASANITTVDLIKRYGGSTSPDNQWPAEEGASPEDEDKFERLEKLIEKSMKKMTKSARGKNAGSTLSSMGGSSSSGPVDLSSSAGSQGDR